MDRELKILKALFTIWDSFSLLRLFYPFVVPSLTLTYSGIPNKNFFMEKVPDKR